MKAPHATEGQRITATSPLFLKKMKRGWRSRAIPVVGDVEQPTTDRATGVDLID